MQRRCYAPRMSWRAASSPLSTYGVTGSPCVTGPSFKTQDELWEMLHPDLSSKLWWIWGYLKLRGWQPSVSSAWRDKPCQDWLRTVEKVTPAIWSLHMGLDEQGRPASLAVDVVDERYGTGDRDAKGRRVQGEKTELAAQFFQDLGQVGKLAGLEWGGDFKTSDPVWKSYGIEGWDPFHLEMPGYGSKDIARQWGAAAAGSPAPGTAGAHAPAPVPVPGRTVAPAVATLSLDPDIALVGTDGRSWTRGTVSPGNYTLTFQGQPVGTKTLVAGKTYRAEVEGRNLRWTTR